MLLTIVFILCSVLMILKEYFGESTNFLSYFMYLGTLDLGKHSQIVDQRVELECWQGLVIRRKYSLAYLLNNLVI